MNDPKHSDRQAGANGQQTSGAPLAGLRVLELGQLLAGPFVGHRLGDFGADVIKIEAPGKGDAMREWGHHRFEGRGLWWPVLARNKRCITADMRKPEGRDLVLRLVEEADALVENFRPGTLEKWGLGPEELHAVNPRLIIVRVSGFGQTGRYAQRAGFASVGEAMGGLRHLNGYPDQPPPRMGISLGDTLTAMFAVQGLLIALYWRDAKGGGKGQVIDTSIVESCFAMLESAVPEFEKLGVVRQPSGTALANVAPSNIYKAKDGKWVVIAANLDAVFRRLTAVMGMPELADDPKFADHVARGSHAAELDGIVAGWVAERDSDEIDALLNQNGVVCGPIYTIADIVNDPYFRERNMIVDVEDPRFGSLAVPGIVPKLSLTAGEIRYLGRDEPGADNREVYRSLARLSDDEVDALEKQGVI